MHLEQYQELKSTCKFYSQIDKQHPYKRSEQSFHQKQNKSKLNKFSHHKSLKQNKLSPIFKNKQKQVNLQLQINAIKQRVRIAHPLSMSEIQRKRENKIQQNKNTSLRKQENKKLPNIQHSNLNRNPTVNTSQNLNTSSKANNVCITKCVGINKGIKSKQQSKQIRQIKEVKRLKKNTMQYDLNQKQFLMRYKQNIKYGSKLKNKCKNVYAESYTVIDAQTLEPILTFSQKQQIQMASLTKIMTSYLTILLASKYNIQLDQSVRISEEASMIKGTTASLKAGDQLNIDSLLFGLMLPSGNDAAFSLAQFFGRVIYKYNYQKCVLKGKPLPNKNFMKTFIYQMNKLAKELSLSNTNFNNPHGLSDQQNYSTSLDLALLSSIAIRNQTFYKVVNTKKYSCSIYNERTGLTRQIEWFQCLIRVNSNRLLGKQGFQGIKTGVTPNAGPCFAAYFNWKSFRLLVVILNTSSLSGRFRQAQVLVSKVYQLRLCDQAAGLGFEPVIIPWYKG